MISLNKNAQAAVATSLPRVFAKFLSSIGTGGVGNITFSAVDGRDGTEGREEAID